MMGVKIDMGELRDAVKRRGIELAEWMGIHKFSLYRKLGQSQIGLDDLNEICYFLGRDAKDFLVYREITSEDIKAKREKRETLKKKRKQA
jgi:DNA-binding Xre family transcriptional regulator